jgi:hypothetical protein
MFDMTPMALKPFIEDALNLNWSGIPIENYQDKKVSPELRYDEYTSTVAKKISEVTNKIPYKIDIMQSPKRIDHIIKGFTGTQGKIMLSTIDELAGKPNYKSSDLLADMPYLNKVKDIPRVNSIIASFFVNAKKSNTISQEYYEGRDTASFGYEDLKASGKVKQDSVKNVILDRVYGKFDKTLGELRKAKEESIENKKPGYEKEVKDIDNAMLEIKKTMLGIQKEIEKDFK